MFPGAIGIDVAKDIDRGIAALDGCSRLIVDLRGNTGGGIGGLRLMSYLTPGKLEVGYSLTRKRRERGYRREELTRFGRIPSHKATLIWLAARYAFVEKSILVVTEGLGQRRFHGRVVLLVNEHTASAGEMVSAFAEENNLATIVGTKTPGRLLSGSAYKVGHGYRDRRDQILACTDPEVFEKEVHKLVAELKTSHTGFRHAGMRNIPARHAINATLQRIGVNGTERWMFQDVHQGGPAFTAGIRPGDLLLECGGQEVRPPNDLTFSVGESASLLIEKLHGEVQKVNVQLPMPKSQKHPVTAPQAVTTERLSDEIGLLRVAMFPGAIGIDVAKDIDRGIAALDGCNRLIVDLRGNTGGGIGGLRLMSYLTPGKLEVGYSLTRKRRERGYRQ